MKINERIEQDSWFIKDLELCQLRLIKDELIWFVLIPKIEEAVELTDLSIEDQQQVLKEVNFVASKLKLHHTYDKLNVASIGNIVSQLHIHIVARLKTDRAWPGVIWGNKSQSQSLLSNDDIQKWIEIFK